MRSTATIKPLVNAILGSSISVTDEAEDEQRAQYWKSVLDHAGINSFPNLSPLRVFEGRTDVEERICSRNLRELEQICQNKGVTLQAAGQAAWAQVLSAYLGEENVTFGIVLSGRDIVEASENTVFPCLTTVPIAVEASKKRSELLAAMMDFNANVRKHQFTPMKAIQRAIGRPNEPLFDTIFAFQKMSTTRVQRPWKVVEEVATSEVSTGIVNWAFSP
jgi:non-ribosomal peptide synthetase component F